MLLINKNHCALGNADVSKESKFSFTGVSEREQIRGVSYRLLSFMPGDKYLVVDSGGGTVDLTVHQIRLPEGHLKELYKATGEYCLAG